MIEIIVLEKESDFLDLYFKSFLSCRFNHRFKKLIFPQIQYLFCYQNHVYGLYSLNYTKNDIFYLSKSDHRSIYFEFPSSVSTEIFLSPLDKKKILNIFKKENTPVITVYLKIILLKDKYVISFATKNLSTLFSSYEIRIDSKLKELLKKASETRDSSIQNKAIVKNIGEQLYQFVVDPNKEFSQLLNQKLELIISNKALLPLELFCCDDYFPFVENTTVYHKPPSLSEIKKHSTNVFEEMPSQKSFLLLHSDEDENLVQEMTSIKSVLSKSFTNPFHHQSSSLQSITLHEKISFDEIKKKLKAQNLWHFSCHGEQINNTISFLFKGKVIFDFEKLKTINEAPQILFLNICNGDSRVLRRWFFSKGGKVLISAHGKVETHHLVKSIRSFYWQLVTGKKIKEAFASFQKQQLYFNNNPFRFQLYGDGDTRL